MKPKKYSLDCLRRLKNEAVRRVHEAHGATADLRQLQSWLLLVQKLTRPDDARTAAVLTPLLHLVGGERAQQESLVRYWRRLSRYIVTCERCGGSGRVFRKDCRSRKRQQHKNCSDCQTTGVQFVIPAPPKESA